MGVKVTLMVQLAPTATEAPQVFVTAKGTVVVMLEMVNGPWPELVRLTICAGLVVPTTSEENVKLLDESVTAAESTPVPLKAML